MSSEPVSSSPASFADRSAAHAKPSFYRTAVLRAFGDMTRGHLRLELPDGTVHEIGNHAAALTLRLPLALPAAAHIRVKREAFFKKCILAGDIGFAESFIDGDWETPHLAAVIAWFLLNVDSAPTLSGSTKKQAQSWALNLLRYTNRLGHLLRPNSHEESFEDWVTNRFGRRLFNTFFKTYTEKVWGIPCHEIRAEWAAQRIKDLSFGSAVRQALFPKREDGPKSLIREFHYPRLGPGMMWEMLQDRIASLGGSVRTREEVTEVHHDGHQVTHVVTRSGNHRPTDIHAPQFISTMALDDLIARLRPAPPAEVVHAAASLRYRDFVLVGLVVRRTGLFADNWLYIHSPNVRVGRIQNFGNWSPDLVPDPGTSSIGMEYFCNRGDSTWTLPDDEFVHLASREVEQLGLARAADVAWGVVIRQPKAYPVYDTEYRRHLDVLRNWLPKLTNFQTIGRNGQHRYNNQDHSMLTAMAAVDAIAAGSSEKSAIWDVNAEDDYHEAVKK